MAQHVRGKLFRGLFQKVRQGDIVKMMDPLCRVLAAACLQGDGGLDILPLKVKMAEKLSAVAGA